MLSLHLYGYPKLVKDVAPNASHVLFVPCNHGVFRASYPTCLLLCLVPRPGVPGSGGLHPPCSVQQGQRQEGEGLSSWSSSSDYRAQSEARIEMHSGRKLFA